MELAYGHINTYVSIIKIGDSKSNILESWISIKKSNNRSF